MKNTRTKTRYIDRILSKIHKKNSEGSIPVNLKEFTIILKNKEDKPSFIKDMDEPQSTSFLINTIPNRSCHPLDLIDNDRRVLTYHLNDEEAELIKRDPRVEVVEKYIEKTIKPFGFKDGTILIKPVDCLDSQNVDSQNENQIKIQLYDEYRSIVGLPDGSGVDVVIVDGIISPNNPELANNRDGTGGTRVNQINWFQVINYNNPNYPSYPYLTGIDENNDHGSHVSGTVAGNTQGWAKKANIYNIYPYASYMPSGNKDLFLYAIKIWHENKIINENRKFNKILSSNSDWDAQVYSTEGYTKNIYCSAKASQTNGYTMFGLNSDPTTDASYGGIDYAWHFTPADAYIYESGYSILNVGSYTTSTEFKINYDGQIVTYLKDNVVQRTVGRVEGVPLHFDSSIYSPGSGLSSVVFGPVQWTENFTNNISISYNSKNPTIINCSWGSTYDAGADTRNVLSINYRGSTINPSRNYSGAKLTAVLNTARQIKQINVMNQGVNYTNEPDISFYGGGQETATAVLANGSIKKIVITDGGSNYDYNNPPTVTFSVPPAGGVRATGVIRSTKYRDLSETGPLIYIDAITNIGGDSGTGGIYFIELTEAGSGYTSPPTVTFSSPGAGGRVAQAHVEIGSNFIKKINLTNGGTGNSNDEYIPYIILSGGNPSQSAFTTISPIAYQGASNYTNAAGAILNGVYIVHESVEQESFGSPVSITLNGGNYASAPIVSFFKGNFWEEDGTITGNKPEARAVMGTGVNAGKIMSINILNPGSGYTSAPKVVVTNGGGFTLSELKSYGVAVFPDETAEFAGRQLVIGIPARDASVDADMQDLIASGVVVVAAAGNEFYGMDIPSGQDYNNIITMMWPAFIKSEPSILTEGEEATSIPYKRGASPGACPGVICVGATEFSSTERKTDFSNTGPRVDVYAPGEQIQSVIYNSGLPDSIPDPRNSDFCLEKYSGTSMASPQVAGIIACYAQNNRNINQASATAFIINNARPTVQEGTDYRSLQGGTNRYAYFPLLATPTPTLTPTPTQTTTKTPTPTLTNTPTTTNTLTLTVTPTLTNTHTSTQRPVTTQTPQITKTPTPTLTNTKTPTTTPTNTPTPTNTQTLTVTPTLTNTQTLTNTPTPTNTRTLTNTPTLTNTSSFKPTSTATRTPNVVFNDPFNLRLRYGAPNSLIWNQRNLNRIVAVEAARNYKVKSWSQVAPGTQNRSNYASCGDNNHCYWNGTGWVVTGACSGNWIGSMTLTKII